VNIKSFILSGLITFALAVSSEDKPSTNQPFLDAEKLLSSDKSRSKGISELVKFAREKKDGAEKFDAKALISEVYRGDKKFDKAMEAVSDCSDFDKISRNSAFPFKSSYLKAFLELAHCKAVEKDEKHTSRVRESFKMLDYAESNTDGMDKARSQYKYGAVLFDLNEFGRADVYLRKAIETAESHIKEKKGKVSEGDTKHAMGINEYKQLKPKIDELLFLLSIELLNVEYGEGYALYVKARALFNEKSYDSSITTCRALMAKHPDTVYGQAIRLTYADCLLATGNEKEARRELENFIKESPGNPYAGEAMVRLGRLALEKECDAIGAEKYFRQALAWLRAERQKKDAVDLYAVPEKVVPVSAPGGPMSRLNAWGRTIYRKPDPKEIANSRTAAAPWYADDIEKTCRLYIGLLIFMKGDFSGAKEEFSRIGTLDKDVMLLEKLKVPNLLMRLRGACDQGYLQTPQQHMMKFQPENRLRLYLADLYWTMEKHNDAISICEGIVKDAKAGAEDKAYALSVKARSQCSMGDIKNAERTYQSVYDDYRKTLAAPYALMQLGFISNSKGGLKAIDFYEKCRKEYPGTAFAECSLARCVYTADGIDAQSAWKYAEKYLKEYPSGKYSEAVKKTIEDRKYDKFRG